MPGADHERLQAGKMKLPMLPPCCHMKPVLTAPSMSFAAKVHRLRTRAMTVQSLSPRFHDRCKKGEVWEFEFDTGSTLHVVPVRLRDDKDMPNSEETYRDVRVAHTENITQEELEALLA